MSSGGKIMSSRPNKISIRQGVVTIAILAIIATMALDTKIVKIGSSEDIKADVFSPEKFGKDTFPSVQTDIISRATDAVILATAIAKDKKVAMEKFGVAAGIGAVLPVTFTAIVGERKSGTFYVDIEGMPENVRVRVQTGPAVSGTDLRDASGTIKFGQFTNQIEYQDAGSALNKEMKNQILSDLDRDNLTGKTISVVGVFKLINPKNWFVTPVSLEVK